MINKGLFSSNTDQWATPWKLFNELNSEFHFELDVCADETNHKCDKYYTIEDNGLIQSWKGVCWMNPPYGRNISKWIKKAYDSSKEGSTVVCLIPSRTDTAYWHDYVMFAYEIRFIRGRLKFGDSKNSAPFPSAIVVFDNTNRFEVSTYDIMD